ncbi:DUF357 domain-containing protein [Candidatus Pacearchaeota archaeon]|nr:MAG: DUF357 domain-containing protein [Candidatus Pacearchaeota archaeon]
MQDKITNEKLERYFDITQRALAKAKENIIHSKESEAKEIIEMTENYLSDAKYFKEKQDFVNAFAALNYAHGWLDSGARLKIFNVKDNKLFTI